MRQAAWIGSLCGLFLMTLGLPGAITASAAEVVQVVPSVCVDTIASGAANGIGTGELVSVPRVRLCDGSWHEVVLQDGLPTLVLTNQAGQRDQEAVLADNLRLPDGEVTLGANRISRAWLVGPTTIYRHGILGDRIEASGLHLRLAGGARRELFLGADSVFEDLRARLVDLTGDGVDEVLVIRSYLDRGASLAVYGLSAGAIVHLDESPPIGLPHRWLNPAGAADFDGDGEIEIALVETPHIGGVLRIFALRGERLVLEHAAPNFSNHAIGSRNLDLSAVLDWDGDGLPDLALPDASRTTMTMIGLASGKMTLLASQPHGAEIVTAVRATDLNDDGNGELLYGLSDGRLVLLKP